MPKNRGDCAVSEFMGFEVSGFWFLVSGFGFLVSGFEDRGQRTKDRGSGCAMLRMFQPSSTEFWQLETSKLETPEQDSSGTVPARFFARTSAVSAPLRLCVKNSLAGDCPRGFRSFQVFKFTSLQVCKL